MGYCFCQHCTVCLINAPCFGILLFMRFKMCQSSAVQRWIDLGECASVVRLSEHLFSFQFLVFSFSWRVRRSVSKPVIASQPDQSQLKWAPTDWKKSTLKKRKGLSSLCGDYQMEVVAIVQYIIVMPRRGCCLVSGLYCNQAPEYQGSLFLYVVHFWMPRHF